MDFASKVQKQQTICVLYQYRPIWVNIDQYFINLHAIELFHWSVCVGEWITVSPINLTWLYLQYLSTFPCEGDNIRRMIDKYAHIVDMFTLFIIIWGIDCLSAQKWRKCQLGLSNPPPCLFQCVMKLSYCHLWIWQLGELHVNRHATLRQNSCTLFISSLSGWAWFLHKNNRKS